jgi:hypothetical protein
MLNERQKQGEEFHKKTLPLNVHIAFLFDKKTWGAERHHYSTFNVQCSMLDVHFI